MTIKRMIRKNFRKARRDVCRFIVSFDTCPKSYRKDYKEMFLNGLACVALCLVSVAFFFMCMLLT